MCACFFCFFLSLNKSSITDINFILRAVCLVSLLARQGQSINFIHALLVVFCQQNDVLFNVLSHLSCK